MSDEITPTSAGPMTAELARIMAPDAVAVSEADMEVVPLDPVGFEPDEVVEITEPGSDSSIRAAALEELAKVRPIQFRARMKRFFACIRQSNNIRFACTKSGLDKNTVCTYRAKHQWFRDLLDEAVADWGDMLDMRGQGLAIEGYFKAVYHEGCVVGYERIISERLLLRLLERAKPERWGPTRQEVKFSGAIAQPVSSTSLDHEKIADRVRTLSPLLVARKLGSEGV